MRFTLVSVLLCVATVSHAAGDARKASGTLDSSSSSSEVRKEGANDAIKVSGTRDGKKVRFPTKSIAEGVKATIGLLESCCSEGLYNADELKKAEKGDHVRFVFAKPVTVTVLEDKVEVSEMVLRLPLGSGVFWLRSGDKVRRYSKYEFKKEQRFEAWLREAQPAD